MVFVYFLRAKLETYSERDFFVALHLAQDMEEDYYVYVPV